MKPALIVISILLSLAPWLSGGREPVAALISVFGLTVALIFLLRHRDSPRVASLPLRILTSAWIGWAALSLTWTANRFQTEMWILYALLGVLVFAATARLSDLHKGWLLAGYCWIATIAAIYGLFLYLTGDYNRLTSSFYWANPAAAYLLPAAVMTSWRWVGESAPSWKTALAAAQSLLLVMAIWLTDSRGALLAAALILILILALPAVRRRAPYILGILALGYALSLGMGALRTNTTQEDALTPGSRFSEAAQGESSSGSDRWNFIKSGFAIWQDNPVFGTGAGTYGVVHPQYQQNVTSASNNAHNFGIQTLAEQGFIGALLLFDIIIILGIGVFRGARINPVFAPAAVGGAMLALHFGLDINDRYPAIIALLAALIGVTYRPWHVGKLRPAQRATLLSALVIALILSISAYRSSVAFNNGRIYDDNRQYVKAAASYADARKTPIYNPDSFTAEGIDYFTLASITNGSKTYTPKAKRVAKLAIAADPKDSQHYFLLARTQRLNGEVNAATKSYQKALELDSWNHPVYYVDLASLYASTGERDRARELVRRGLELYPPDVLATRHADASVAPAVAQLKALKSGLTP